MRKVEIVDSYYKYLKWRKISLLRHITQQNLLRVLRWTAFLHRDFECPWMNNRNEHKILIKLKCGHIRCCWILKKCDAKYFIEYIKYAKNEMLCWECKHEKEKHEKEKHNPLYQTFFCISKEGKYIFGNLAENEWEYRFTLRLFRLFSKEHCKSSIKFSNINLIEIFDSEEVSPDYFFHKIITFN